MELDRVRGDNRTLENLKIDLENHIEVIQSRLDKAEAELVKGDEPETDNDRVLASLKKIINQWRRESKNTRDWTKCNQLISELKNLI